MCVWDVSQSAVDQKDFTIYGELGPWTIRPLMIIRKFQQFIMIPPGNGSLLAIRPTLDSSFDLLLDPVWKITSSGSTFEQCIWPFWRVT